MRVLICDLTRSEAESCGITEGCDVVYTREELGAGRACTGCFGCWVKTPGRCILPDVLQDLGPQLGAADELLVVSRACFGSYSPLVKRAIDRILPYLHPSFRIVEGHMHHRMRYANHLTLRFWFYGPSSPAERACLLRLVEANRANYDATIAGVWFPRDISSIHSDDEGPGAYAEHVAFSEQPDVAASALELRPPARIGLVLGSPRGAASASHTLLEDFADALAAYARVSHDDVPEMLRFRCQHDGTLTYRGEVQTSGGEAAGRGAVADAQTERQVHAGDDEALSALASCDALVIGYPLYVDGLPSHLLALLDRLADSDSLAPDTRVYAISNLGFYEADQIMPSFDILRCWCSRAQVAWSGGVAVGGGGMIVPTKDSPRMGGLRRRRSHAIDGLIAAVRMGTDVDHAAELTGGSRADAPAGVIMAPCPLPRPLYRLAAELRWRRLARRNNADLDARLSW